ncbi:MAG TPA: D-Ala-D-Ala carboxypeptidase family metallohydrolase [Terrimicrobiaceae bacterium]|nr:D-Ala-D-Ala carboxypeptidase family metallohydrolase [Terrimicrobiaceae bacterium]
MTSPENHLPAAEIRPSLLTRRGALRLLTLTGASMLAGSGTSHAFMDFFLSYEPASPATLKKLGIPPEWMSQLGSQLPNYAEYLRKANLRGMTVRQIIQPHTHVRGSVKNSLPPRALWGNIRSTLKVIDALGDRLNMDVKQIVSAYRSPAYNARCAGAKSNSYHLRNIAIDVTFDCPPGKVAAMARAMRAAGLYRGGVGRYGGFTHVDTRGSNADW